VLSLVGCADGSLCRVDVSSEGASRVTVLTREWEGAGAGEVLGEDGGGGEGAPPSRLLGRVTRSAMGMLRAGARPPARAAVLSLAWADGNQGGASEALVLTEHAVEAWRLPCDDGGRCLVSRDGLACVRAAVRHPLARPLRLVLLCGADALLLAAAPGEGGSPPQLWLMHCSVESGEGAPLHGALGLTRPPLPLSQPAGQALRLGAQHQPLRHACVRAGPQGAAAAVLCVGGSGHAALLCAHDGSLLASLDPRAGAGAALAGAWSGETALLLTQQQGLLHCTEEAAAAAAAAAPPGLLRGSARPAPSAAGTGPVAPPSTPLSCVAEAFRAGASGEALLASLRSAGALQAGCDAWDASEGALVQFAVCVLDTLPKRWGGAADAPSSDPHAAAAARLGSATTLSQLRDKEARLEAYLGWLRSSGLWAACAPGARLGVLAALEQLGAAQQLLELRGGLQPHGAAAAALQRALAAAGAADDCPGGPADAAARPCEAVFERPSRLPRLFAALAQQLQQPGAAQGDQASLGDQGDQGDQARWPAAEALVAAVLCVVAGAEGVRSSCSAHYPPLLGRPAVLRWTAGEAARAALTAAATACAACQRVPPARAALLEVAAVLLDACKEAVACQPPGSAQRRQLLADHALRRDALLPALLRAAMAGLEEEGKGKGDGVSLEAVAELGARHGAYDCLYSLCSCTGDGARLVELMRQLPGGGADGEPPFSDTVFQRLRDDRRLRDLLDKLPEEWNPQLRAFLAQEPRLGWLHALREGRTADAARMLQATARAPGQRAAQRQQHLLRLAKLAHLAAGQGDSEEGPACCDAECELLELHALLGPRSGSGAAPLQPGQLAEALLAALPGGDGAVAAVRAFAAAPAAVRAQHEALLGRVWRCAAEATDWAQLAQQRGHLADAQYAEAASDTPLARAADAAFAPTAVVLQAPFARPGAVAGPPEVAAALAPLLCADDQRAEAALLSALQLGAAGWEARASVGVHAREEDPMDA